jgi:hypothetical protein
MLHSTLDIVVRILTLTSLIFSPILPSATVSAHPSRSVEREAEGLAGLRQDQAGRMAAPGEFGPSNPRAEQGVLGNPWNALSDYPVADADEQGNAAANRSLTPAQTMPDLIFADEFESGDLSAWSDSEPDDGDLVVTATAAGFGDDGLEVVVDDTIPIYVIDDSPNAENRYRARFYFNPNSIVLGPRPDGTEHIIFEGQGYEPESRAMIQIGLQANGSQYEIRAKVRDQNYAWFNVSWVTITNTWHFIEFDWQAASMGGANDGRLTFWVDGVQERVAKFIPWESLGGELRVFNPAD